MPSIAAFWLAICSTGVILSGDPLTFDQAAREAEVIIAGKVLKVAPRWGDASRRWIETEYQIEISDTPAPTDTLKKGGQIAVVVWGGTIGDETHTVSDLPYMQEGKTYVLMLRPEWIKADKFSPVVGFYQGFFPVVPDDSSDRLIVVDHAGRPVYAVAEQTRLKLASDARDEADSRQRVSVPQFMDILRADMRRIQALPRRESPASLRAADAPAMPKKKLAPRREPHARPLGDEVRAPRARSVKALLDPEAPTKELLVGGEAVPQAAAARKSDVVRGFKKYVNQYVVTAPIVINQLPASAAPWSPVDEHCISNWEHYTPGLIRVMNTPSDDAGYGDGVFDIVGWCNEAELIAYLGHGWPAEAMGICPQRVSGSVIVEADIAFNDALDWTLNDEALFDGRTKAYSFRATMIHEFGHLLGMDHTEDAGIMWYRALGKYDGATRICMDDAHGVRANYPRYAAAATDLGIRLFHLKDSKWIDATYPASVGVGKNLFVDGYLLENVGTVTVAAPRVEWYLCSQRNFNSAYYYVGTSTYGELRPFYFFFPNDVGRNFTVPTMPAGNYYLGAFIRTDQSYDSGIFPFQNSMAFSRKLIAVTP